MKGVGGEAEGIRVAPQPVKEDTSGEGASSEAGEHPASPSAAAGGGPIFEVNSATAAVKEL